VGETLASTGAVISAGADSGRERHCAPRAPGIREKYLLVGTINAVEIEVLEGADGKLHRYLAIAASWALPGVFGGDAPPA
jgi:hypothetical protein